MRLAFTVNFVTCLCHCLSFISEGAFPAYHVPNLPDGSSADTIRAGKVGLNVGNEIVKKKKNYRKQYTVLSSLATKRVFLHTNGVVLMRASNSLFHNTAPVEGSSA